MNSAIGTLWQARIHPGDYMIITNKKVDDNHRTYYNYHYIDDPDVTFLIDTKTIDRVFKKVS